MSNKTRAETRKTERIGWRVKFLVQPATKEKILLEAKNDERTAARIIAAVLEEKFNGR